MEPDQLWQTTIVLPDADQIRTNARNYGLQVEDHSFWSPETARYISTTLCTYRTCFGHWTESWLKRTSVTSCDQCWWQHWGNWIVEEFSSTIQLPVLVCPITKGQGIRIVDHVMAVSSKVTLDLTANQVWFWGWLETAKQKRHILDGMEGPFLFCCVTWKQQLLIMLLPWAAFMWIALWLASLWDHFPCVESFSCKPQANHFLKKWSVRGLQQINLCSQIFRFWIDHWLCNLTDNDNFLSQKILIVGEPVLHHLASNLSQIVKMVVGLWLWKRNQCFQDKPCLTIQGFSLESIESYLSPV